MVGGTVDLGIAVRHPARCHIRFHADDRFDSLACRRFVEIHNAEHCAMVGDRHGRHVELLHALDQFFDIGEAVEQGIFRVDVKMSKGHSVDLFSYERRFVGLRGL